jgi:hypothetical protein
MHQYQYPCTAEDRTAMCALELNGLAYHANHGLVLKPPLPSPTCKCDLVYSDEGLEVVRTGCSVFMSRPQFSSSNVAVLQQHCPNKRPECTLHFKPQGSGLFQFREKTYFAAR